MRRWAAIAIGTTLLCGQVRRIGPGDLPPELRSINLDAIHRDSLRRVTEGELDHMIFFALQSGSFTQLPRIEPARSAREYQTSREIPPAVAARLKAFLDADPGNEQHVYFRTLAVSEEQVHREYRRTMAFLFEKEWESRALRGDARRDFVASLYQKRAHSTDSSAAANYAIYAGLAALRERSPGKTIRRVLIAGPGMEIAPRTGLDDDTPPQSLQPYLTADTLIRLGWARPAELTIHCADINPRVVRYLRGFPRSSRRLRIRAEAGDEEWNGFFHQSGSAIGRRDGDWAAVSLEAARQVTAFEMNILTERTDPPETYDLVIATNVLLYFNREELGLAFANLAASLAPGGYLLHNDIRPETESWGNAFGLPVMDARMVRLAAPPSRQLYDSAVVHARR